MNNIEIQEKDLELVVSEKTLGSLTTNARQIRDLVLSSIDKYDVSNYNDDNIDQAKKDKAALNKAAKALNDKRIEIEKEFSKPFTEFKEIVSETITLIKECSSKIDAVVKANDEQYREKKKVEIVEYFNANNTNLISIEKVFKVEWLNKTASLKSVKADIDTILKKIDEDIISIESFSEDKDVLIAFYTDCLNIGNTIQYANRLKEQREKRAAAEEEAKRLEEEGRREKDMRIPSTEPIQDSFFGATNIPTPPPSEKQEIGSVAKDAPTPEMLTRAFTVTATRENIIALGDFMNDRSINFDKIDLEATLCKTDMNSIERLLNYAITIVNSNAEATSKDLDFARKCGLMRKKIVSKLDE